MLVLLDHKGGWYVVYVSRSRQIIEGVIFQGGSKQLLSICSLRSQWRIKEILIWISSRSQGRITDCRL